MTPIEQTTLADGFRLALLAARIAPGGQFRAVVVWHDGGRETRRVPLEGHLYADTPAPFRIIGETVAYVAAPPHVLVGWGHGYRSLLLRVATGAWLARLRLLDLRRAALALATSLPPRASEDDIFRAFGIGGRRDPDAPLDETGVALLWAVLAEAGRRGLDWPGLLRAAAAPRLSTPFDRYEFDPAALARLPAAPAVYRLLDAAGQTLYVGKTANLRRRMTEHFRSTDAPTSKGIELRERTRSLEYRSVGSELEALLLEADVIRRLRPAMNAQRVVRPGHSRHAGRPGAFCAVLPSAAAGATEVIAWAPGTSAWQLRVRPRRPPRRALAALFSAARGERGSRASGGALRSWGRVGAEIAHRYHARAGGGLHWFDMSGLPSADAFRDAVLRLAREVLASPRSEPAEFRFADGALGDAGGDGPR